MRCTCPLLTQSGHWPLLPRKRIIYAGYSIVRPNLSIAVCAPMAVESVTIIVKVTVPLRVGVPDNTPAGRVDPAVANATARNCSRNLSPSAGLAVDSFSASISNFFGFLSEIVPLLPNDRFGRSR